MCERPARCCGFKGGTAPPSARDEPVRDTELPRGGAGRRKREAQAERGAGVAAPDTTRSLPTFNFQLLEEKQCLSFAFTFSSFAAVFLVMAF